MKRSIQLFFAVSLLLLIGCHTPDSVARGPGFVEIRLESRPPGWGYAHKTLMADGAISGGHLSGGPDAPRVFESRSQVTSEDMKALKALTAKVVQTPTQGALLAPERNDAGYTAVTIVYADGTQAAFLAEWGGQFQPDTVQAIWEIVGKYRVGAW